MGNFTPPPDSSDGGSVPDVPIPDFTQQAVQTAAGLHKSSFWTDLIARMWASVFEGLHVVIHFFVSGMDDVLAIATSVVTEAQGTDSPGFFSMVAAIIEDLMGVKVSADAIRASYNQRGRLDALRTVGGDIYDQLAKEFAPAGAEISPESGLAAAKAFVGFLTEFAVRQGNVAFLSELIPLEFNMIGGLREYGETLAKNLGLGRLSRRALTPLIQTLIADPLQWQLNAKYHPKLLSEAQLVRGFFRNTVDLETFERQMSYLGYSQNTAKVLLAEFGRVLSEAEIARRSSWLKEDPQVTLNRLKNSGMDDVTAGWLVTDMQIQRQQPFQQSYLNLLVTYADDGFMTTGEVSDAIDAANLADDEREAWKRLLHARTRSPRKHLTETQLEHAYLSGIITLSDYEDAVRRVGYSEDAIEILAVLLLEREDKAESKAAAAARKIAGAGKKTST